MRSRVRQAGLWLSLPLILVLFSSPILTPLLSWPTKGDMKRANLSRERSLFETLEERCLFAAISLNNGVMNITGTANSPNHLAITLDTHGRLWGVADNVSTSYLAGQVRSININEGSAGDQYAIGSTVTQPVNVVNPSGAVIKSLNSDSTPPQDPPNVDPTAPVAVLTPTSATSILPGQAVFVNGLTSVLNGGTCLTAKYQWDFGDPGSQFDQLVGFNAGHAYESPGSYTITLTITNSLGKVSTATQIVHVAADNRPTIYVDSVNGSDANSGATPGSAIKTFAHLASIIQPNEIVLFDRGETFPVTSWVPVASNDTFDAYGTGSSPVLQWQAPLQIGNSILRCSTSTQNAVIQNLTFDTLNPSDTNMPDGVEAAGTGITVRDNTFLNVASCVNANGSPEGLLVQGNSQPLDGGMVDYLVWFQGQDGVIIGNTSVNSTRQHNIRASYNFSRLLIEDNNLQNLDRRTSGDPQDYDKSTINMQWGSYIYINNNVLTGGTFRLGPLGGDELANYPATAKAERESWVVAEDNIIDNSSVQITSGSQDMMLRDNVVKLDNQPAFWISGWDSLMDRTVNNVSFLNNTVINNGTQGNCFYFAGLSPGVVMDNNLYIAPNIQIGSYSSTAPVYIAYNDLSGFTQIANNVWPDPPAAQRTWWANGGINYMLATNDRSGFYNETAWDQLPGVTNDIFENVVLANGYQVPIPNGSAGANIPAQN